MELPTISIYTDGSCDQYKKAGGWAAILVIGKERIVLQGHAENTTHQRMELTAIIEALEYVVKHRLLKYAHILYTDSQYASRLFERKEKLAKSNFITSKNSLLPNTDLIKKLYAYNETLSLKIIKVKAHLKVSAIENLNREVDKLSRKIMRESRNSA